MLPWSTTIGQVARWPPSPSTHPPSYPHVRQPTPHHHCQPLHHHQFFTVICSSRSMSAASFRSSAIAASRVGSSSSSPSDVFLDFCKLNCQMMLLTTRFNICRNHRVWFMGPGKWSSKLASSSTIVSLFNALSQVIERIYTCQVSQLNPLHKITCSPCRWSWNLQGSLRMQLPN